MRTHYRGEFCGAVFWRTVDCLYELLDDPFVAPFVSGGLEVERSLKVEVKLVHLGGMPAVLSQRVSPFAPETVTTLAEPGPSPHNWNHLSVR